MPIERRHKEKHGSLVATFARLQTYAFFWAKKLAANLSQTKLCSAESATNTLPSPTRRGVFADGPQSTIMIGSSLVTMTLTSHLRGSLLPALNLTITWDDFADLPEATRRHIAAALPIGFRVALSRSLRSNPSAPIQLMTAGSGTYCTNLGSPGAWTVDTESPNATKH